MDLKQMLFTELVSRYLEDEDEKYEIEFRRRLAFCSFDEEYVLDIVRLEMKIIEKRNLYLKNNMIDSFSWFQYINDYKENENFRLFNLDYECYAQIDNLEILDTTLSTAELIILFTDGKFVLENNLSMIPKNMYDEMYKMAYEDNHACDLKLIFNGKFDLVYKLTNDVLPPREYTRLAARFFRNEMQIINKYKKINNYLDYEPYTSDYFKYYETI